MTDINYTDINYEQLFQQAEAKEQKEHAELEVTKRGILRAGNSGCVGNNGLIYGGCPRLALARFVGGNIPVDFTAQFYFDAGRNAEELLAHKLTQAGVDYLREEQAAIQWEVNGVAVTGRPDFLILDDDGKPKSGIELKGVASQYTASMIGVDRKPAVKHLCQAAHYMWQHNVPWTLMYYSLSNYQVSYTKKIMPFRIYFDLSFKNDVLWYRDRTTGKELATVITVQGIKEYYDLIVEMSVTQQLSPRPANRDALGKDLGYNQCTKCEYRDLCDVYDEVKDYEAWLQCVKVNLEGE